MKNKLVKLILMLVIFMSISGCSSESIDSIEDFRDDGFYLINYVYELDVNKTMRDDFVDSYRKNNMTNIQKEYYTSSIKCYELYEIMRNEDTIESYNKYIKEKEYAMSLYDILLEEEN